MFKFNKDIEVILFLIYFGDICIVDKEVFNYVLIIGVKKKLYMGLIYLNLIMC